MSAFIEQYAITFKGLKTGVHQFSFSLDKRFFSFFECPDLEGGDMRINIELDKKPDFLKLSLKFSGTARVLCDRCLEEFDIPLDFDSALYIKFGEEGNENDADVIFLDPGEHKFNLADYFIESIRLNIPLKKVHENIEKEGLLCNREMIRKLNEHTVTVKNGETDPRWDSLRNLISNRN